MIFMAVSKLIDLRGARRVWKRDETRLSYSRSLTGRYASAWSFRT